ncbi:MULTISPECIES: hypothetical protein [unclassified Nocardia]|uniref:hypothetical protein n=1 Tax=unclassified Nocardia TaxID=2637762 RepID=UPI001CE47122|nr:MULTISPECIES: hypothetical protein [unclassified Nocardia]
MPLVAGAVIAQCSNPLGENAVRFPIRGQFAERDGAARQPDHRIEAFGAAGGENQLTDPEVLREFDGRSPPGAVPVPAVTTTA